MHRSLCPEFYFQIEQDWGNLPCSISDNIYHCQDSYSSLISTCEVLLFFLVLWIIDVPLIIDQNRMKAYTYRTVFNDTEHFIWMVFLWCSLSLIFALQNTLTRTAVIILTPIPSRWLFCLTIFILLSVHIETGFNFDTYFSFHVVFPVSCWWSRWISAAVGCGQQHYASALQLATRIFPWELGMRIRSAGYENHISKTLWHDI